MLWTGLYVANMNITNKTNITKYYNTNKILQILLWEDKK